MKLLLFIPILLCSCAASRQHEIQAWAKSNAAYQAEIVDAILLPHYMTDPAVPMAQKMFVGQQNAAHLKSIAAWEAACECKP